MRRLRFLCPADGAVLLVTAEPYKPHVPDADECFAQGVKVDEITLPGQKNPTNGMCFPEASAQPDGAVMEWNRETVFGKTPQDRGLSGAEGAGEGAPVSRGPRQIFCRILPDNGHLFSPVGGLLSSVFIPPELTPSPVLCAFSLLLSSGDRAELRVVSPLAYPLPPHSVFAMAAPGATLRAGQILAWLDLGRLRTQGGAPLVEATLFSARSARVLRTRKTRGVGGESPLFLVTPCDAGRAPYGTPDGG